MCGLDIVCHFVAKRKTLELARKQVDDIRQQAVVQGRDPRSVKIIAATLIIVADTDEAAQAKLQGYNKYGNSEGALVLFGGVSGYDLDKYADDQDVRSRIGAGK
jgi:long-chain alkane monooxygenase